MSAIATTASITTANTISTVASNVIGRQTRAIFKDGRFVNPWLTMTQGDILKAVFKWKFSFNQTKVAPLTEDEKINVHPILPVDLDLLNKPVESNKLRCTWIGHSTFFLQMGGSNFMTDPVFSDRCSPFSFAGPKRYRDIPIKLSELPKVDFIFISHNHYDHLDISVVKEIGNSAHWFVPSGLKSWFKDAANVDNVTELSWYDQSDFKDRFNVVCLPAHHSTNRGLTDRFKTLWCSWSVMDKSTEKKVYFGGDTAYCDVFKEIGDNMNGFDLSIIPIGAYAPRMPLKEMHIDPAEAVEIHKDIKSKRSIGCHWGTFILSDEPLLEPPKKLKEATDLSGLPADEFNCMKIGETREYSFI